MALEAKRDSKATGSVLFEESNGIVKMIASINGLSEGIHAIHAKADCSSVDGKSTGGHWNPTAQPHGAWGAKEGYHKGELETLKYMQMGRVKNYLKLTIGVSDVEMIKKIF